jgi:hypothetical protein
VADDETPATGLALDARGRLWASWGLRHLFGVEGALRVRDGERWTLVSACDNRPSSRPRSWPFHPTSFQSVATAGDRVFVLTSTQGVVELRDGVWRRRTFGWPRGESFVALAIDGDTAIIGTRDAGVLLWNLRSDEKKLLRLGQGRGP